MAAGYRDPTAALPELCWVGGLPRAVVRSAARRDPGLRGPATRADGATILGTISGAIFGLVMAIHFRLEARRLGLPNWEAFPYGLGTEEEEGW